MKRLSLIFAALMLVILQISADGKNATITLSHNGVTTTFQSSVQNVIFKKCYISNNINNQKEIDGLYLDRCEVQNNICNSAWYVNNVICRNCKLRNPGVSYQYAQNWYFYNCTFTYLSIYGSTAPDGTSYNYCREIRGIFVNCIFNSHYNEDYHSLPLYPYLSENSETTIASFTNCLFYPQKEDLGVDMFAPGTISSGIMYYTKSDDKANRIEDLTKEELLENSYLGTDGTVVGCQGGKYPFSLVQSQVKISSAKVHLDREQGNVKINLNVSVIQ